MKNLQNPDHEEQDWTVVLLRRTEEPHLVKNTGHMKNPLFLLMLLSLYFIIFHKTIRFLSQSGTFPVVYVPSFLKMKNKVIFPSDSGINLICSFTNYFISTTWL